MSYIILFVTSQFILTADTSYATNRLNIQ